MHQSYFGGFWQQASRLMVIILYHFRVHTRANKAFTNSPWGKNKNNNNKKKKEERKKKKEKQLRLVSEPSFFLL